jgi:hypothetical protein
MVTANDIVIPVNGLYFMIALTANIKSASQPFIPHTRFERGFINCETTNEHRRNKYERKKLKQNKISFILYEISTLY